MLRLYGSTGVASVMQMVREATRASASDFLIFYLTRSKIMKMIRRGSKADEPVLAIGEATEDASTENFLKKRVSSLYLTFTNLHDFFRQSHPIGNSYSSDKVQYVSFPHITQVSVYGAFEILTVLPS